MGAYARGAKAGGVAGLLEGVLAGVWSYYVFSITAPLIRSLLVEQFRDQGLPPELADAVLSWMLVAAPVMSVIVHAVVGVVLGLLLVKVWEKLAFTWPVKGLAVAAVYVAVSVLISLVSGAAAPGAPALRAEIARELGALTYSGYLVSASLSIIYGLLYSYLLEYKFK